MCDLADLLFFMQEFSMVRDYMESLEKPQNYQNWWVGSYTGVGPCLGQNSSCAETIYSYIERVSYTGIRFFTCGNLKYM